MRAPFVFSVGVFNMQPTCEALCTMAFDYTAQALKRGKTVPLVLNQLHDSPVIHVEWLGDTNASWMSDMIAQANAKKDASNRRGGVQLSEKVIADSREKNREILAKHAIRDIEAIHHDTQKPATRADIPAFVKSLPDDVIDTIRDFVTNPENFRERAPESTPKELAEK